MFRNSSREWVLAVMPFFLTMTNIVLITSILSGFKDNEIFIKNDIGKNIINKVFPFLIILGYIQSVGLYLLTSV